MFALPGHDLGDVWPHVDEAGDIVHLFFLVAPSGTGKHWSIGHATSRDLAHWDYHGIALAPGPEGAFDDLGLATGSILRHDGRYWMFYTGHSRRDVPTCGRVGLAVSDDLFAWRRAADDPVAELDPAFYEDTITGSRPFLHWRDPFVFAGDDALHMVLCARRRDGPVGTRGTVAHLTGTDPRRWRALPPLAVEPFCEEMECPLLHRRNGRWHLMFSTHHDLIAAPDTPGGLFVQTADRLTGPYHGTGRAELPGLVPGGGYLYAAQWLRFRGGEYFLGTRFAPDGSTTIAQPIPAGPDRRERSLKEETGDAV